jgi:hypothetical protein
VSEAWPPLGPQQREPLLEHGGELIESRLSRYGIEPLLLIADQIKANLIAQGWFDPAKPT